MSAPSPRIAAFAAALSDARRQRAAGHTAAAFAALERAHVLGQRDFGRHLRVHLGMLRLAWAVRDGFEVRGQLLRLALTPLGHLTGRLPPGNTGSSKVSAFEPMVVPSDLARLLDAPEA